MANPLTRLTQAIQARHRAAQRQRAAKLRATHNTPPHASHHTPPDATPP